LTRSAGTRHGFVYSNGTYTTLNDPSATGTDGTVAIAINASGQVAGDYFDSTGKEHGFVYSNGTYTTLTDPAPSAQNTFVLAINASGQVAGDYVDTTSGTHGFLATPSLPLPPIVEADRAHVQVAGTVTANAAHGVLAIDTDPIPNDTLIVSAVDGQASNVGHALVGSYGTLTLNADGSYSCVANQSIPSNIIAQDIFTYTASDGDGGSTTSSLTIIITQAGQTYIAGTPGQALTSGNGSAFLDGSLLQNQTISAGNGIDAVIAGLNDTVTLGNGTDVVDAGDSNTIKLGNGTDTVTAGANSIVTAGNGNDTVAAGANSTITLGNGDDTVTAVSSLIQAGKGHDSFIFTGSFGQNTITNFNTALDTIQLSSSEFANFAAVQNHMQQVGANTVITYDAGDAITLAGVKISSLHASDFHFV
jgi:probable HAF family extracellular repeat protein